MLLAPLAGCILPVAGEEGRHLAPASVEEVLGTEYIGRAEFSEDGRWLLYNLVPPYEALSDYSYWMRAGGLSGHQVWVKDLSDESAPRLQPGLDHAATNFLFGISPDSRRLVALEHWKGRLRLVACRIGADDCVRFDPMPDIRDRYIASLQWNERLVWISPDRFVMPVRPDGLPGSEMRSRGAVGTLLWEAWNEAWSGKRATASEVTSTGRDRSTDWAEGDLAVFDTSTGKADILLPGRYAGVVVSPDGSHLLVARVGERRRPEPDARLELRETHPMFDRRYAPHLVNTATGEALALGMPFHVDPGSFTWRADSRAFAVFGWDQGEQAEQGRFYVFETESLSATPLGQASFLFTGSVDVPGIKWWTGPAQSVLLEDGLAAHGRLQAGGQPGWFLLGPSGSMSSLSGSVPMPQAGLVQEDAQAIVVVADGQAFRLEPGELPQRIDIPGSGKVQPFEYRSNSEHGWSNESFPMSRRARKDVTGPAMLLSADAFGNDLGVHILIPGPGMGTIRIDVPGAGGRVLAASAGQHSLLATYKDSAATRLVLFREGRAALQLARINTHLNRVRHPETRRLRYTLTGRDAGDPPRVMSVCLLLPPGFDPSKRYPVLLEVYPAGTGGTCLTLGDAPSTNPIVGDLWAARGFIYVRPGFPLDLVRTPRDPLGRLGLVLDETIDVLVARGFADPGRVVVFGASQGGMASLVAAVQSKKPAAVISMHGWSDYFSHYFGARGLMRYFHLDQNGGDNRWRYECREDGPEHACPFGFGTTALSPEAFARASPVAQADRVSAPIMLVHSDLITSTWPSTTRCLAPYRSGREARYVRYWGEGHGNSSPANIRDLWMRIDRFLEEAGDRPE